MIRYVILKAEEEKEEEGEIKSKYGIIPPKPRHLKKKSEDKELEKGRGPDKKKRKKYKLYPTGINRWRGEGGETWVYDKKIDRKVSIPK